MIYINRTAPPPCFSVPRTANKITREINKLMRMSLENLRDYKGYVYKKVPGMKKEINKSLLTLFNHKCAYCETKIKSLQLEHFRPKVSIREWLGGPRKVEELNKKYQKGYCWLACDWNNLFPSCKGCNDRDTGKDNWFPIADENQRATGPGTTINETPLILNPCEDQNIHEHLFFDGNGNIKPYMDSDGGESIKGYYTIEILSLQLRLDLVQKRAKIAKKLDADLKNLEIQISQQPTNESKIALFQSELTAIERTYVTYDKEFSQMATQIINRRIPQIISNLSI